MALLNTQLSTSPISLFVAGSETAITVIMLCNTSVSTDTYVDVYAVPNGSNPSLGTMIMNQIPIPVGETFVLDTERLILGPGDGVYATANDASTITATVSYLVTG